MAVIVEHNRRMYSLVGQEYAIGTFKRYEVLRRHTEGFLKANLNATDSTLAGSILPSLLTTSFICARSGMGNNAVVKHMKMFRKIINICLGNGWMNLDSYLNFKGKFKKVDKAILTKEELDLIARKKL